MELLFPISLSFISFSNDFSAMDHVVMFEITFVDVTMFADILSFSVFLTLFIRLPEVDSPILIPLYFLLPLTLQILLIVRIGLGVPPPEVGSFTAPFFDHIFRQ